MFFTIYKITNKINDKIYIGKHQTARLDDDYFGSGKHLKRSVEKYGRENFIKEILHVFDNESDMNAKEAELVTYDFCNRNDTYNICEGGKGGWSHVNNVVWTPEKRKILNKKAAIAPRKEVSKEVVLERSRRAAETLQKLFENEHYKKKWLEKISLGVKKHRLENPRNVSNETKQKISLTNSIKQAGMRNSQYGTKWSWITNGFESKKVPYVSDDQIPGGWRRGQIRKVKQLGTVTVC